MRGGGQRTLKFTYTVSSVAIGTVPGIFSDVGVYFQPGAHATAGISTEEALIAAVKDAVKAMGYTNPVVNLRNRTVTVSYADDAPPPEIRGGVIPWKDEGHNGTLTFSAAGGRKRKTRKSRRRA